MLQALISLKFCFSALCEVEILILFFYMESKLFQHY